MKTCRKTINVWTVSKAQKLLVIKQVTNKFTTTVKHPWKYFFFPFRPNQDYTVLSA